MVLLVLLDTTIAAIHAWLPVTRDFLAIWGGGGGGGLFDRVPVGILTSDLNRTKQSLQHQRL